MLDSAQLQRVEERLRAVEARTGVQVVVAALERSDVYHGLRWRAFALGAAVSGVGVALGGALRPGSIPDPVALSAVAAVLGAGLIGTLAATLCPAVARLFLEPPRPEAEVRQRAGMIFLERELFATRDRTAVLLLASDFERLAVILADTGLRGRVAEGEWRSLEETATAQLRAGGIGSGLLAGLDALEGLLLGKGFAPRARAANELLDRPVTGPGAP